MNLLYRSTITQFQRKIILFTCLPGDALFQGQAFSIRPQYLIISTMIALLIFRARYYPGFRASFTIHNLKLH